MTMMKMGNQNRRYPKKKVIYMKKSFFISFLFSPILSKSRKLQTFLSNCLWYFIGVIWSDAIPKRYTLEKGAISSDGYTVQ